MSNKTNAISPRANLLKYTRKAFMILPKLEYPTILDAGCGDGVPTLELAKLSNGQILGFDINPERLLILEEKIKAANLSDRIHTMECSITEMHFQNESFDIIWAEGSISFIGFRSGLEEFSRLLKPRSFLVIHDELENLNEKLNMISKCGYKLLDYFILSTDIWRDEYYLPLKKNLDEIHKKHPSKTDQLLGLSEFQREIDQFENNPDSFQSVFFIMQKN